MASMGTVSIKDVPEVRAALEYLAALAAAIRERRDAAAATLEGIRAGAIAADDEGRVRAQIEADVWDEVAELLKPCGAPISYLTPAGTSGEVPCDLTSLHDGDHDSSQLLLRPGDTVSVPLAGW